MPNKTIAIKINPDRWTDVRVSGGTTQELRATAEKLVKQAEHDSSVFSGEKVRVTIQINAKALATQ